ncbi:hypothetical protein PAEVO_25580 [Paenibacillus sp. GM2FR]|uniref:DUF2334 domain-containing protein n=1 Tax=Paenibacillus sp. GM2FR TaxID=2059268 RepID=UPI000C2800F6|nr:DUF2334 domain-containing protein [Paenibacillus sp. GM2FR]PJN55836.1 hypothetical protein PAEVO_25580 [Paenibacillus sp. GM2FR]
MNKALIRLEDIGPGGWYETEEQQAKLLVIAQFLHRQRIPFHLAVIPRYVDPAHHTDRSIDDLHDEVSLRFVRLLRTMVALGASLGIHGYTHQYSGSVSGDGFEFAYPECWADCPPDDSPEAVHSLPQLQRSYAYQRIQRAHKMFQSAGLAAVWYETPHYTASSVQRHIIEICNGILYESPPSSPDARTAGLQHTPDDPLTNGTIYVPTPLYYVAGDKIEEEVTRMERSLPDFTDDHELASFFYHPYLEFPYIRFLADGTVHYDEHSPLRRIIQSFKRERKSFVSISSILPFIPDFRETRLQDRMTMKLPQLLHAPRKGKPDRWIVHDEANNLWYDAALMVLSPIKIHNGIQYIRPLLADWPLYPGGTAMAGDYDGNGSIDTAVWNAKLGICEVALDSGGRLVPSGHWLCESGAVDWKALTGDFDGDGRHDLFLWDPVTGKAAIAYSSGCDFYSPLIQHEVSVQGVGMIPSIGDVNGDGLDDLVVWNSDSGTCQVWLSSGKQLVDAGDWYSAKSPMGSSISMMLGDVDGDGLEDLVLVEHTAGNWFVLYSSGTAFAFGRQEERFGPWVAGERMMPFVGDLTGNGRVSLLAWSPNRLGGTLDAAINSRDRTIE